MDHSSSVMCPKCSSIIQIPWCKIKYFIIRCSLVRSMFYFWLFRLLWMSWISSKYKLSITKNPCQSQGRHQYLLLAFLWTLTLLLVHVNWEWKGKLRDLWVVLFSALAILFYRIRFKLKITIWTDSSSEKHRGQCNL